MEKYTSDLYENVIVLNKNTNIYIYAKSYYGKFKRLKHVNKQSY